MVYTKKEMAWTKYAWIKLGLTIIVYIMFGASLVSFVNSLDGLEPIIAHTIVFGIIGVIVSMGIDIVDKKRI